MAAAFHIGGDLGLPLLLEQVGVVILQHGVLALDDDAVHFRTAVGHVARAQRHHLGRELTFIFFEPLDSEFVSSPLGPRAADLIL